VFFSEILFLHDIAHTIFILGDLVIYILFFYNQPKGLYTCITIHMYNKYKSDTMKYHICEVCEYITDCIEDSIEEQENQYYQMISWQYDE
jgi:hypothetical protein